MPCDLDTFLVAVYTLVDDLYRAYGAPHKPRRPGPRPVVSDSEVLTLALAGQWLHCSERALLRYATQHWQAYFPRLLSQSAYNRRCRDLSGVLVQLAPQVARELRAMASPYQVIDTVPLPLMKRCRGQRHRLFGEEAAIGQGGADQDWYYGCKLLVATTAEGVITGMLLGPVTTDDRWLADAFWCWRVDPDGCPVRPEALPPSHRRGGRYVGPTGPRWPRTGVGVWSTQAYVVDRGFAGAWWVRHWAEDYGAVVVTPSRTRAADPPAWRRELARWRQVIETVNAQLTHVLGLGFPGAKTRWGLLTRVAAKLAAWNVGIWLNQLLGRPRFALATLFCG